MTVFFTYGFYSLVALALIWAGVSDLQTRKINNMVPLIIASAFCGLALVQLLNGISLNEGLIWPALVAALTFIVTLGLFAKGVLGGGDTKLISVMALIAGPALILPFLMLMTIAGGVVALTVLAHIYTVQTVPNDRKSKPIDTVKVPYGIAIMLAGLWVCGKRVGFL